MTEPIPGTVESTSDRVRRFVEAAGFVVARHDRGQPCAFCRRLTRQQIEDGPSFCTSHAAAAIVRMRYGVGTTS